MSLKFGNLNFKNFKLLNLYSMYFGLSPREQTIALVVAAAVLILIVVLPVTVASGRISRLEAELLEGKKQFKNIMRAIETYDQKKAQLNQMQQLLNTGFDSSLSTTIESMAENSGIKEQIDSLKEKAAAPSETFDESSVDVKLKKVSLEPLINFLYGVEHNSEKVLRLKQLSIKPRFDNKQELDASFTISTYKLLEGAGGG